MDTQVGAAAWAGQTQAAEIVPGGWSAASWQVWWNNTTTNIFLWLMAWSDKLVKQKTKSNVGTSWTMLSIATGKEDSDRSWLSASLSSHHEAGNVFVQQQWLSWSAYLGNWENMVCRDGNIISIAAAPNWICLVFGVGNGLTYWTLIKQMNVFWEYLSNTNRTGPS